MSIHSIRTCHYIWSYLSEAAGWPARNLSYTTFVLSPLLLCPQQIEQPMEGWNWKGLSFILDCGSAPPHLSVVPQHLAWRPAPPSLDQNNGLYFLLNEQCRTSIEFLFFSLHGFSDQGRLFTTDLTSCLYGQWSEAVREVANLLLSCPVSQYHW